MVGAQARSSQKIFSAIKDQAESTGHDAAKSDAVILEKRITNYTQRIFLEALHSVINKDTVNEHAEFPSCYLPLIKLTQSSRTVDIIKTIQTDLVGTLLEKASSLQYIYIYIYIRVRFVYTKRKE